MESPTDNKLLDDYLSEDEKNYFKSGGDEEYEERLTSDESNKESEESGADDSRAESEHSDRADEANSESDESTKETSDEVLESDDEDERGDDDEKSSKRDYEKAFKTERYKRKELKEALEQTTKKTAEMEATLSKLQQAFTQQQMQPIAPTTPPEDIPDADVDPLGYQQYQIKQLEKQITEHNKYLNQRHEYEQRNSQNQAFLNTYQQAAKQFADKNPDFADAYKFLTQSRMEEHQAAGFSVDEANRLLLEEEESIVAKAFNDKVNPAERVYNLAKKRGFSGSTAKKPTANKSIKDLKKGMANAKSLGSGGGELPEHELGIDDIDSMSNDEFEDFFAKFKSKSKGRG